MSAFRGAVEVGAEALETDIHLTRDGVVVLSHDQDLMRCFGREEKIIDCDYEFLSKLRTLKAPYEPLPRLADLLEYLTQPGLEEIWVMLDIKLDNDAGDVMRLIGETIKSVLPSPSRPWHSRIVLGCWAAKYLPLCSQYLPGFPVSHIGFSTLITSYFFTVSGISLSLHQGALMAPWGRLFVRQTQREHRAVHAWTVTEASRMRWDIRQGLDGVITDDPKLFLEVRDGWHEGTPDRLSLGAWLDVVRCNLFVLLYSLLFHFMARFQKKFSSKRTIRR